MHPIQIEMLGAAKMADARRDAARLRMRRSSRRWRRRSVAPSPDGSFDVVPVAEAVIDLVGTNDEVTTPAATESVDAIGAGDRAGVVAGCS